MTSLALLCFSWLPLTQRANAVLGTWLEGTASFALGQRGQVHPGVEE